MTANFQNNLIDRVGVYRPSTGEWFLDRNGSATWNGCGTDGCIQPFTSSAALPVVGDWDGSGITKLGVFVTDSAQWLLDANGNGVFEGCQVDACIDSFGQSGDLPVIGKWSTALESGIGLFRPSEKRWHLDSNSNDTLENCYTDACVNFNNYQAGDLPVVGDWLGRGTSQLGLFRPSTRQWFLDRNKKKTFDGCGKDTCFAFGSPGDLPVMGDWNGSGLSKVGVFRPSTGEWFLDLNGNHKWDGPTVDLYVPGFGMAGDLNFGAPTAGSGNEQTFGEPPIFPGGISFGSVQFVDGKFSTDGAKSTIEVVNLLLGIGNDELDVQGTLDPDDPVKMTGTINTRYFPGGAPSPSLNVPSR